MKGIVVALLVVVAVLGLTGQGVKPIPVSLLSDWTDRYVIFPQSKSFSVLIDIQRDPRYWRQWWRQVMLASQAAAIPAAPTMAALPVVPNRRDWTLPLGGSLGPQNTYPAKYVFNVAQPPDCTADFLVTGVNTPGSSTQANIIGLNRLYTNATGKGYCAGYSGPNVIFAYNVGSGSVYASPVLSLDGRKVAFIENNAASSYFHVLTYATGPGNGTGPGAPAVPGVGNTAVDTRLPLGEGSTTAVFVDYLRDVAYVTTGLTTDGRLRKFTGVFNGTPAELTTGGWPVIHSGRLISTPVFDSVTRHVFFKAFDGHVHFVDDSVTPVAMSGTAWAIVSGTDGCARPVIVDSTNQKIYAHGTRRSTSSGSTVVGQADTELSSGSRVVVTIGLRNSAPTSFAPDLNNAYYTGTLGGAYLYAVGNDNSTSLRPALYRIGFDAGWKLRSTTADGPLLLTTTGSGTSGISSSPLTEFYNSGLGKDFLFVGVSNRCSTAVTTGCIRSLDITTAFPTSGNVNSVILAATGGTSGITVDNNAGAAEASSVYFVTLTGNTLVKATQAELH